MELQDLALSQLWPKTGKVKERLLPGPVLPTYLVKWLNKYSLHLKKKKNEHLQVLSKKKKKNKMDRLDTKCLMSYREIKL